MFGDVGLFEVAVLLILALFIFGPERLPKMAAELGRGLRQVRRMAMNARRDLQDGLGPEMRDFDFTELNPRTFVRKNLLEGVDDDVDHWESQSGPRSTAGNGSRDDRARAGDGRAPRLDYGERPPYDSDAT